MFGNNTIPLYKWKQIPSSPDEDDEVTKAFITKEIIPGKHRGQRTSNILLASFTLVNLVIFSGTLFAILNPNVPLLWGKNHALKQCSYWSPVLHDIEITTSTTLMNGTFFPSDPLSIARLDPGPSTDAAWSAYDKSGTFVATREQILKLGKDPNTVAKFDDEYWDFGDDAYMVQLDVFHQIHCLNLLRMAAFSNYPGNTGKSKYHHSQEEDIWWTHLGHCLDMLLQNLKCNANTDLITLTYIEARDTLFPDFSINHQCRDFEAVVRWQEDHKVDETKLAAMPVPKDVYRWPSPWLHPESELGHKLSQEHQQEGRIRPQSPSQKKPSGLEEEPNGHDHGHDHL